MVLFQIVFSPPPLMEIQHCAFRMETFRVHDLSAPTTVSFRFVFNTGLPSQAILDVTHVRRWSSNPASAVGEATPATAAGENSNSSRPPRKTGPPAGAQGDSGRGARRPAGGSEMDKVGRKFDGGGGRVASEDSSMRVIMSVEGINVTQCAAGEHLYSCHIRQVGTVTFNPLKQVCVCVCVYSNVCYL